MTPAKQEALFAALGIAHPDWTAGFRSGYCHGVHEEEFRQAPSPTYLGRMDDYALGYLTGFAVRNGDCAGTDWYREVRDRVEEARASKAS